MGGAQGHPPLIIGGCVLMGGAQGLGLMHTPMALARGMYQELHVPSSTPSGTSVSAPRADRRTSWPRSSEIESSGVSVEDHRSLLHQMQVGGAEGRVGGGWGFKWVT